MNYSEKERMVGGECRSKKASPGALSRPSERPERPESAEFGTPWRNQKVRGEDLKPMESINNPETSAK